MKKVSITIENGDNFELMVDGEIEKITISTNKGDYEISKEVKIKDKTSLVDIDFLLERFK